MSSTYLEIKFNNYAARKRMFYPAVQLIYDLFLSSVDRNLE